MPGVGAWHSSISARSNALHFMTKGESLECRGEGNALIA